jgi:hypothetical protein
MKSLYAAVAAVALLAVATPAHAVLQISALVNGDTFFCADGDACDLNLTPGVLSIGSQTIGGVLFEGSSQFQTTGAINTLLTNSLTITNNTGAAADIQFAVGGTDFTPPTETFSASGSGTWLNAAGSSLNMVWYGDTANNQGASDVNDLPGLLLTSATSGVAGPGADSFSTGPLTGPWVTTAPFSWTMGADGTLAAGATASLAGRSQDITSDVTPISEPGALALLGGALVGMGLIGRRRRGSAT